MLDWKDIEENYPKAYNRLVGETAEDQIWICHPSGMPKRKPSDDTIVWENDIWNVRLLYDFFDSEGIIGWVDVIITDKEIKFIPHYYSKEEGWFPGVRENTRERAECALFIKLFELLEQKLTKI